jgi:hypothetical protein
MAPNAGGVPTDTLGSVIKGILDEEDFTAFKGEARKQFASAWVFNS